MSSTTPLPQNDSLLNRSAWRWLKEAREQPDPQQLHVLTSAQWGLDQGLEGEWPPDDRYVIEMQIGHLLGWSPQEQMDWLLSNPNGEEDPADEETMFVAELKGASSSDRAASVVLSRIYSRMVAVLPALRPAAS